MISQGMSSQILGDQHRVRGRGMLRLGGWVQREHRSVPLCSGSRTGDTRTPPLQGRLKMEPMQKPGLPAMSVWASSATAAAALLFLSSSFISGT